MAVTAKHSGKLGDICFSIPAARAMGVTTYLIPEFAPESDSLYSTIQTFMQSQGFECLQYKDCDRYETRLQPFDIDLDEHRNHPLRGKVNMVQRYYDVFNLGAWEPSPWLQFDSIAGHEYAAVNLTPRFRDNSNVHWGKVLKSIKIPAYFVGLYEEHKSFVRNWGPIPFIQTSDAFELANVIAAASVVYCNQSFPLSVAMGLDKPRHVEFKRLKTNCKLYTKNEYEIHH